ncbi:hypothetical protein [Micromonospora radicis]|uniref:hypothetical protein n=1 Tax=Micromonospora radicis TaxID=1894971 RepID=UPI002D799C2A|nr:hypothetical protein [Micromonospora radicis]
MTTSPPGPAADEPWRRPDTGDEATSEPPTDRRPPPTAEPPPAGTPTPPPGIPPASPPPPGIPTARPTQSTGIPPARPTPPPGTGGYLGPPPTTAPPAGWRPPVHLQPSPPRQLPVQDMAALDAQEQRAQRVTWGVGTIAGVVALVLVCLLCARVLF